MSIVHITRHAYDRGRQRLSFSKKALDRLALLAYKEGLAHQECKGELLKYFDELKEKEKKPTNIKLYGEYVFIFIGFSLITVFQLPQLLRKYIKYQKFPCNNETTPKDIPNL